MQLLFLAFEAALYPTLLAAVVILLSQPRRFVLLSAYLAGGLTISVGLGLLIVHFLQGSRELKSSGSTMSWTADLAVGGLALLAAVALSTRADERVRARRAVKHPPKPVDEDHEPWSARILSKGSAPIVFAAGLAINIPGAAYLIGLKDIAAGHHPTGQVILLVLLFNAIMFLLAEIPWLALIFAPNRVERMVAAVNGWLGRNGRALAIVLCALLGIFLVTRGVIQS